ncbi:hypothetical protein KO516_22195 [Citreicella sp. C3M06]|uniref:hypothetical protein n=1 Tax=Citreicella sp. C3M06 TaxID=2841564 RepID=UPI001C097650|nr:hypothetical protein [Citreicella sp. C3M06]MBU2963488.1 hypothetical protein [Citreicella sp. C3M06]
MAQTDFQSDGTPVLTLVSLTEFPAATDMLTALLGAADPRPDSVVAATLEAALHGDGPVLAVAAMPERMLARALASGVPPSKAVADWQVWAEAQLALLRRARARVLLLGEDTLLATPGTLIKPLADRLGCGFGDLPSPATVPENPGAALHEILARHLLKSTPRLRGLAEEMSASIVGDLHPPLELAKLDRAFADLSAAADPRLALQQAALEESCRLLRAGLIELQHQLADETAARALLQAERDGLEARIAVEAEDAALREAAIGSELLEIGRDADARSREAKTLWSEAEALRGQMDVLRAKIDDRSARMRALELELAKADETCRSQAEMADLQQKDIDEQDRKLTALRGELDQARSELNHIHDSKSWKIAGAIRSIRYGFRK